MLIHCWDCKLIQPSWKSVYIIIWFSLVTQKYGNWSPSRLSYITIKYKSKGFFILPQRHCSTTFIADALIISINCKTKSRCPSTDEWTKMWYIYIILLSSHYILEDWSFLMKEGKRMGLDWSGGGEELGEVEGRENVVRTFCVRKESNIKVIEIYWKKWNFKIHLQTDRTSKKNIPSEATQTDADVVVKSVKIKIQSVELQRLGID